MKKILNKNEKTKQKHLYIINILFMQIKMNLKEVINLIVINTVDPPTIFQ